MFINYIFFLSILITSCFLNANELPIGFSSEEISKIPTIYDMGRETDPPETPIRNIAEYEPMQGVLIRYPFGIYTSLIAEMSQSTKVYCLVTSNSQSNAYNSMNNNGANMNNVEFINGATDSYWTRDYGPWWVVDGNNSVSVVDHTYNRPRPNDNDVPLRVSNYFNTPYFASDIVTAGGNYMTDGLGIGASSLLIYDENPSLSESVIHDLMQEYYGVHEYYTIDDPNNTYIDHIDCWGKFLSPSKVLIRSVQSSHPQYDELEETVDYFESRLNSYGEPWEVFRVYTPYNQPYTNSLILNDKVFVPIMNSSWDDDAIATYENAMPGYQIIGFTGTWESTDALHCRTKGIPDLGMLQIFHNPINNQIFAQNNYEVHVVIDPLSGSDLIDSELAVFWKNDNMDDYEQIVLTELICADCENEYAAFIPGQAEDTTIKYFIRAADYSGRQENLPMAGYFEFTAIGGIQYQLGDVNQDEQFNVLDVVLAVNGILGTVELSNTQFILADLNNDSTLNVLDVIMIVNIILG